MWCTLVYSRCDQSLVTSVILLHLFCLLCSSLLTRQSNFLSLLYHSSSYISLLSPRCYWSKNGTEINPELRRPKTLSFTTFTGYCVWMHLNASHRENILKGPALYVVLSASLLWGVPGVTMGCTDKPVIQILQLCLPHLFPLPPALWALIQCFCVIASPHHELSLMYLRLIIHLSAIAHYFMWQLLNLSLTSELQPGLAFLHCLGCRAAPCYRECWWMGEGGSAAREYGREKSPGQSPFLVSHGSAFLFLPVSPVVKNNVLCDGEFLQQGEPGRVPVFASARCVVRCVELLFCRHWVP